MSNQTTATKLTTKNRWAMATDHGAIATVEFNALLPEKLQGELARCMAASGDMLTLLRKFNAWPEFERQDGLKRLHKQVEELLATVAI